MLPAQHKSRTSNSALVPMVCEVCRSHLVEAVVVEFIFTCDRCAEKIRAATGGQRVNTAFFSSRNRNQTVKFADRGGLSPTSLESLLKLFPAKKYSLHHSHDQKH